ncbi:MAG: hypothetical protein QM811_20765 [Pirellulales bacterium]
MAKSSLAFLLLLACVSSAAAGDLLERIPDTIHKWKVVKQTLSDDEKRLDVEIENQTGIFPAIVRWNYPKCEQVTLTMPGIGACEGMSITPSETEEEKKKRPEGFPLSIDLKSTKGVKIDVNPKGVTIVFTGEGLRALAGGGRFQYIDYYRR